MTTAEQKVCDLLYDERSREVFQCLCSKDNINSQFCEPCVSLNKVLACPFVIYGAGAVGKQLVKYAEVFKYYSNCIAIWDKNLVGEEICGKIVAHPGERVDTHVNYIIAIKNREICSEIRDYLHNLGISSVFEISDYFDEQHTEQFFCNDIISVADGEVFVDGGVADFNTSELLLKFARKMDISVKKIYAIEPDRYSFEQVRNIVMRNNIAHLVYLDNAALWHDECELKFAEMNQIAFGTSKVSNSGVAVKARKLDNIVPSNEFVTYIKLDVEGSEYEVLRGAQMIIKRDKPKLAVAVGHKADDHIVLPQYVNSILPEYKLYIRHYSVIDWEPVLYAVL